jgi:exosortase N
MTKKTKIWISVFIISSLIILNFPLIINNLERESLGTLVAFTLFFYSAKATKLKIDYFVFAMILVLQYISYHLHINSLHFLSIELFIIGIYYAITKKFSIIAFCCVLLFSSLFQKISDGFSTEIKQEICKWVYFSLRNFIKIDGFEGVNFYINQTQITIDTACMGLNLFKTGLLLGAIILILEEKKQNKNYGNWQKIFVIIAVIVLNIISNYFRIITLLIFQCIENNFTHQLIGWFSFVVYQVIPTFLLLKYVIQPKFENKEYDSKTNIYLFFGISIILFITSLKMKEEKNYDLLSNLPQKYKNGSWVIKNHVYKKEIGETLIYVKAPFHNPMTCWTGSGYKITKTEIISKNNHEIWKITMKKNNKTYHSYWWYEIDNQIETNYFKATLQSLQDRKPIKLINETIEVKLKK